MPATQQSKQDISPEDRMLWSVPKTMKPEIIAICKEIADLKPAHTIFRLVLAGKKLYEELGADC